MNKLTAMIIAAIIFAISASAAQSTMTIATFADPAQDNTTPLFEVDFTTNIISAGWDNSGLDLIVLNSVIYQDAVFTMADITITAVTDPLLGYKTQAGTIKFLESDLVSEILTIEFDTGWVNFFGFSGADFVSDDVTISGPALGSIVLDQEAFAFSFTNYVPLYRDSYRMGFTATASFTSSAIIPEPATIALMGMGLAFLRRKK